MNSPKDIWDAVENYTDPTLVQAFIDAGERQVLRREGKTLLMITAEKNSNPDVCRVLIKGGAKLELKDKYGWTALLYALVWNENPQVAKALIEAGADVNVVDSDGDGVLHHAYDDAEIVRTLVEAGADPNAKNNNGETPLMYCGDLDAAIILIDAGADVQAVDAQGASVLAHCDDSELTQFFIDSGVDVNAVDENGWTALMHNMWDAGITRVLLGAGADINAVDQHGQTALMLSCDAENTQVLIDSGADINAVDELGRNALMHFDYDDNNENAQVLIDAGIDVNAVDSRGCNALICAIMNKPEDLLDLAQLLIDNGIDVNARDSGGRTALMHLLVDGEADVVQLLLDQGADVNIEDNEGHTVFTYASLNTNNARVLMEMIIKAGADINHDNDGFTVLMDVAANGKDPDALEAVIETGADLEASDGIGRTALYWASLNKTCAIAMMETLTKAGADIEHRNKYGDTVLMDIAENGSNPDALKVLIGAGANLEATDSIGRTALFWASVNDACALAMMETLIRAGADIEHRDNYGATVLMGIATDGKNPDALKVLIGAGANLGATTNIGRTALYLASLNDTCALAMMETLIRAGANIEHRNNDGITVLKDIAANGTNPDALRVLIEAGANLEATSNIGRTALFSAAINATCPRAMMEVLIKAGADIEHRRDNGNFTVLMDIALNGTNPDALRVLIEAGANLEATTNIGRTALYLASINETCARVMMETLIRAGADIEHRRNNGPDRGLTVLMDIAINGKDPDILKVLIEAGADLDAKDYDGGDVFSYAVSNKSCSDGMLSVLRNYRPSGTPAWLTAPVVSTPVQTLPLQPNEGPQGGGATYGNTYQITDKTREARSVIWYYAIANGGIGFAPIPMSDWPLMVAAEIAMTIHIYSKFGYKLTKEDAGKIFQDVFIKLGGPYLGLTVAGKTASSLLKLIPGVGTALGGAINAGVSATITKIYGEFVIKCAASGMSYSNLYDMSEERVVAMVEQAKTVAGAIDYDSYKTDEKFD